MRNIEELKNRGHKFVEVKRGNGFRAIFEVVSKACSYYTKSSMKKNDLLILHSFDRPELMSLKSFESNLKSAKEEALGLAAIRSYL